MGTRGARPPSAFGRRDRPRRRLRQRSGHRAVGRAATAEETAERLGAAGFSEVETWTAERPVTPGDPPAFLRTVVLGPHLARMPPNLHATFVDAVLEQLGEPPVLDYRRLNIAARRPE